MATSERLTWEEIKKRYPHQNVGLVDCIPDSINFETAIVKYTEKDITYDEMCSKAFDGEIFMIYTTPEEIAIATPFLPSDFIK